MVTNTSELIRIEKRCFKEDEFEHCQRLAQATWRLYYDGGITAERQAELEANGFIWIVKAEFVRKFKYAALLSWHLGADFEKERFPVRNWSHQFLYYAGDIPESILPRISLAREVGLKFLTIHSNMPLPLAEPLRKVDPVVLGWYGNPGIEEKERGQFAVGTLMWAVVVAAWDFDKEIELIEY